MTCRRNTCTRKAIRPGGLCTQHYRVTPHGFVDATPSQQRVRELRAAGYGWAQLAKLTGLAEPTLRLAGKWTERNTVCLDTHERIMAVPVPDAPIDGGGLVPALGSQRRIRALMAIGWTQIRIGEEMGWPQHKVSIVLRRKTVWASTAAEIARVYERLHMTPGPSEVIRHRARVWGFPPPLAWDDIDNPLEKPNKGKRVTVTAIERVAELHQLGITDVNEIAERLGIQPDSVKRTLLREAS